MVEPTHLKNMLVKMDHFPRDWGENKNVWNHHLDYTGSFGTQNPHIFSCIHIAVSLIYLEHHQKHIISSLPIKTHWNMKKTQQPPFQSFIQRTNTLLKYQWGPLLPAIPLDPWAFRTRKEDALETREAFDWALPGRLGLAQGRPSHDRLK